MKKIFIHNSIGWGSLRGVFPEKMSY